MPEDKNKKVDPFAPQLVKNIPNGAYDTGEIDKETGSRIWAIKTKNDSSKVVNKKITTIPSKKLMPGTIKKKTDVPPPPEKSSVGGETLERFIIDNNNKFVKPKETVLYGDVKRNEQLNPTKQWGANYGIYTYTFPSSTGNISNESIDAHFDKDGKEISYDKSNPLNNFVDGKFTPKYTGKTINDYRNSAVTQIIKPSDNGIVLSGKNVENPSFLSPNTKSSFTTSAGTELNTQNTPNLKAPKGYVIQKYDSEGKAIPAANVGLQTNEVIGDDNRIVGKMYDRKEKESTYIKEKFKKGGLVNNIKGYYDGGKVYNPYQQNNTTMNGEQAPSVIPSQGIVQTNGTEFKPTGNATNNSGKLSSQITSDKKSTISNTGSNSTTYNAISAGVSGVATDLARNSTMKSDGTDTQNVYKSSRNTSSAVASAFGPIYAIGNAATNAVVDAASSGTKAGKFNDKGEIQDAGMTKQDMVGKAFADPYAMLMARGSYEGGYTDFTGNDYVKSLEKAAKKQMDEAKAEDEAFKISDAIAARDRGDVGYVSKGKYDFNKSKFDEQGNLNLVGHKKGGLVQNLANGGEIKGKGTAKSDSIHAKVEEGTFIAPAENAKIAEDVREIYLGKPPKSKASLNEKGGVPVKLSNGEHKFTPEEKEELLRKGVNVELLAPNAEEENKKDYFKFPNAFSDGGKVTKGAKLNGSTWDGTKWVNPNGTLTAERQKQLTDSYLSTKKQDDLRNADIIERGNEKIKSDPSRKAEYNRNLSKINELRGDASSQTKSDIPIGAKKINAPKSSISKNTFTAPEAMNSIDTIGALKEDFSLRDALIDKKNEASISTAPSKQEALNSALIDNKRTDANGKKGFYDNLKGLDIDPTMLLGPTQAALGMNMLKNTKRPIDNSIINSAYNDNVNRAQADAQYGLTAENKALIEQDQLNALNDARYSARNFAGGNASTAFNQERQAINGGLADKLRVRVADQDLRLQKQQYADSQVAGRADFLDMQRRRSFGDAMGAFNQKQETGGELVSAGLANAIGAYRFNKDARARKESDYARDKWESDYRKRLELENI